MSFWVWSKPSMLLPKLVFLSTIIDFAWAAASCYYPNGVVALNDTPCGSETNGGVQCCGQDAACLENKLCIKASDIGNPGAFYRGSCTDQTWKSSGCPQFCPYNRVGGNGAAWCGPNYPNTWCCTTNCVCSVGNEAATLPDATSILTIIGQASIPPAQSTSQISNTPPPSTTQAAPLPSSMTSASIPPSQPTASPSHSSSSSSSSSASASSAPSVASPAVTLSTSASTSSMAQVSNGTSLTATTTSSSNGITQAGAAASTSSTSLAVTTSSSSINTTAVAIGVAIPVSCLLLALGAWFIYRSRRNKIEPITKFVPHQEMHSGEKTPAYTASIRQKQRYTTLRQELPSEFNGYEAPLPPVPPTIPPPYQRPYELG